MCAEVIPGKGNVAFVRSVRIPYVPYKVMFRTMFRTMLNANIECQQSACLVRMIWVEDQHAQAQHWLMHAQAQAQHWFMHAQAQAQLQRMRLRHPD